MPAISEPAVEVNTTPAMIAFAAPDRVKPRIDSIPDGCDEIALMQTTRPVIDEYNVTARHRGHKNRQHDRARQQILDEGA